VTPPEPDPAFEALLEYLHQTRGFDFKSYKRTTLSRRVQKRMAEVGVERYEDYQDYLEVEGDEFAHLFDTVLINVTSFFRDKEAWNYLSTSVLPKIVESGRQIRVWSAGCASGEEAYTLAMVLAQALGPRRFVDRVKIYATDIDEGALTVARQGVYDERALAPVPEELVERYFERTPGGKYQFRSDLRRTIIFGRNDLTRDAPISRLDLLVCRNTLMYLNAEAQQGVVRRFHFALNPDGFVFLGRAETLLSHGRLFVPVSVKNRVFTKAPDSNGRDLLPIADEDIVSHRGGGSLRDQAFDIGPTAQIVVNVDGALVVANDQARALFGIRARDVGRPLQDLEISYRPIELRSRIEQAYAERRAVHVRGVERSFSDAESQLLDIAVVPIVGPGNGPVGVSVTFADVTRYDKLQEELARTTKELETAYEELQSANEELETSNEELQSTVEELETTNEELQSANEELETINEELQATNEELEATNEELRSRTTEFDVENAFLVSIVGSTAAGIVVVGEDGFVKLWNRAAEEMWGLRADEAISHSFFSLDFGLPRDQHLRDVVAGCVEGRSEREEVELEAIDRRGRPVHVHLTVSPLADQGEGGGAVILIDTDH
jgi:two-component system CheB/CheR fusion protein